MKRICEFCGQDMVRYKHKEGMNVCYSCYEILSFEELYEQKC
jgi:ribosome-binding protein aMBF1 (putative translation factor)